MKHQISCCYALLKAFPFSSWTSHCYVDATNSAKSQSVHVDCAMLASHIPPETLTAAA